MARLITFVTPGKSWQATISKVDRDKVYGWVSEIVTDSDGKPCVLASLLDDGQTIILSGSTSLKTLTLEGKEVSKNDLVAINNDGTPGSIQPSVYDEDVKLTEASIDDLLDLEVKALYQLNFENEDVGKDLLENLSKGKLFGLKFNYRTDYEADDAYLLSSQNNVFLITGILNKFQYLANLSVPPPDEDPELKEEENLDFGLL